MPAKNKPLTKAQVVAALATETGIDKKDCAAVYDALRMVIYRAMRRGGQFKLFNLLNISTDGVPVTKSSRKSIKVMPLKALKEMVH